MKDPPRKWQFPRSKQARDLVGRQVLQSSENLCDLDRFKTYFGKMVCHIQLILQRFISFSGLQYIAVSTLSPKGIYFGDIRCFNVKLPGTDFFASGAALECYGLSGGPISGVFMGAASPNRGDQGLRSWIPTCCPGYHQQCPSVSGKHYRQ